MASIKSEKTVPIEPVLKSPESSDANPDRPELPAVRFWLLALSLCLGLLLSFMDSSIVATSLFAIGTEFQQMDTVNWVALAYTLCYLGFAVFFARLSDVIGRRNAFATAYLVFFAFSLGCGFAKTMNQLIACRAFQGIGGSGLYSITMIILLETTPAGTKQFLASMIGVVVAVGGVLGPVLGGVLTHYTSWRWVFWINGPIGFVSMVLFCLAWPKAEYLPNVERRTWKELDYPGSVLLIAAAVLVVFPFQDASSSALWDQAIFVVPLVVGLACWLGLVLWEVFIHRRWGDKMAAAFPMGLLRNRAYTSAVVNTLFLGFPFVMLVYAFPLRVQVVNGKSSLVAGVMMLPLLAASATGSVLAGIINKVKDRTVETLALSSCLVALGCGLLSTISGTLEVEAKALGFLVFVGLGFGLSAAGTTMVGNLQSSLRDHSPAQGIIAQIRILGGSLGIAASSAILGTTLRSQLASVVDPKLLNSLENATSQLTSVQLNAVRRAYSEAFNEDMRVCAIVASVSVVLAFGAWTKPSSRPTVQERGAQHLKNEIDRRTAAANEY
ncbi:major facilitator superfamily transporter [Truncatella angustata]|uniref:Major facilitator superfamily transporter n=1 Tax=Truncatella angustata TaxID=152316 RepID=A0A9P8UY41_9PEZI|nr:major facilitator superfamily transporter [Truncatella angustata]KAH6660671.1 major facilitator superfamily transporter [Truncatella angustata]